MATNKLMQSDDVALLIRGETTCEGLGLYDADEMSGGAVENEKYGI